MTIKQKIFFFFVFFFFVAIIPAYATDNTHVEETFTHTTAPTHTEERPHLIFVAKTLMDHDFFLSMQEPFARRAAELGMEASIIAPHHETNVAQQMEMVTDLIAGKKADIIAVAPSGPRAIVPVLEEADAVGIPVIIVETKIEGDSHWPYVGTANAEAARSAASFIAERLKGKGKIAVISGPSSVRAHKERAEGFLDEIKQLEGMHVVGWLLTDSYAYWEAASFADQLLSEHPDLAALFCTNDAMAVLACSTIGPDRKKDIVIVGFDASLAGCRKVQEGMLDATVAQFPSKMAVLTAEIARDILDGKAIPDTIDSGSEVIDKHNVDDFIKKYQAKDWMHKEDHEHGY